MPEFLRKFFVPSDVAKPEIIKNYQPSLNLCIEHQNYKLIKKLSTSNTPVILLNINAEDIEGTSSSIELKFLFKLKPVFIIKGMLNSVIKDDIGKAPMEIPIIITEYEIIGNAQNNDVAFCFPTTMTRVFRPLDLSAS